MSINKTEKTNNNFSPSSSEENLNKYSSEFARSVLENSHQKSYNFTPNTDLDNLDAIKDLPKYMNHQIEYYTENAKRLLETDAPKDVRLIAAGRILCASEHGYLPVLLGRSLSEKLLFDFDNSEIEKILEYASFGDLEEQTDVNEKPDKDLYLVELKVHTYVWAESYIDAETIASDLIDEEKFSIEDSVAFEHKSNYFKNNGDIYYWGTPLGDEPEGFEGMWAAKAYEKLKKLDKNQHE